jgi:hypothetical protein
MDATATMLIIGSVTAVVFMTVLLIEGAVRPGYDPVYHTVSELSLGDRGWTQVANFLQLGAGLTVFALGVDRALNTLFGPVFLAIFGFGAIASGIFLPDPLRGYPPGLGEKVTWHGKAHNATGPIMFLAMFAATMTLEGHLEGAWRIYTLATGGVGLLLSFGTAVSFQRSLRYTGLVQRGLIFVYLTWITLLGVHLV